MTILGAAQNAHAQTADPGAADQSGPMGACDFVTGAHAAELSDIASLRRITVEIDKYRKWVENGFRIVTSRQENIAPRFKKKFKADLRLEYDFGSCLYRAKVRQHGDLKDHVEFQRGSLLQSLDVKFSTGNIANAVRWKLFLEATRSGADEILATQLLRGLGMLAPRTRRIEVVQNGTSLTMLMQEAPAKEMLELQGRREGPLFEGDETLIFDAPDHEPFVLEDLALARLVNGKWADKGDASRMMALDALSQLQHAYARYGNAKALAPRQLSSALPLPRGADAGAAALYWDYGAIMLAMRASHGLRPHNRKFYWNALARRFEPLYYDGAPDPALPRNKYLRPGDAQMWLRGITPQTLTGLSKRLEALDAQAFADRFTTLCGPDCPGSKARKFLESVALNLTAYHPRLLTAPDANPDASLGANIGAPARALDQSDPFGDYALRLSRRLPGSSTVWLTPADNAQPWGLRRCDGDACATQTLSPQKATALAEGTRLSGPKAEVLLGLHPQRDTAPEAITTRDLAGTGATLRHSAGGTVQISESGTEIRLIQSGAQDWFVIEGGTLGAVRVTLEGLAPDPVRDGPAPQQRFNRHGLTGCLTLFQTAFDGTSLRATGGGCEDAINLVSVSGRLAYLESSDAMADAVDMDFSDVVIDSARISGAGNDCLDVSAGRYQFARITADNCGDKGLSVGEGSRVSVGSLSVEGAEIGVSSKDSSTTDLQELHVRGAPTCMEAYRKKQEFFGGTLILGASQCGGGATTIGPESVLKRMPGQ